MSQRFYLPTIDGDQAVLAGSEAHHLIHVMRAKIGSAVLLFDGSGAEFPAQVTRIGRGEVRLSVGRPVPVDRELGLEITLGVALPKGDRQRWLVEKAVELGVACLLPLKTQRGVAQPGTAALGRLGRAVIEASKQCGRNHLMRMGSPRQFSEFMNETPSDAVRLIAHPGGEPAGRLLTNFTRLEKPAAACFLAVGPEGGFADDEVSCARQAGWQPVDLGPRILRVETAALALAAVIGVGCWEG